MSEAFKIASLDHGKPPLCVDLDETLVKSDTLLESLVLLVRQRPLLLPRVPFWVLRGPLYLKERLAENVQLDAARLPYNQEVVSLLRKEQSRGRKIILVSGAHRSIAQGVANHLRLFNEVYGSRDGVNLIGAQKAKFLTEKYGNGGFDYIGDSRMDLHVWRHAHSGVYVGNSRSLLTAAKKHTHISEHIRGHGLSLKLLIRTLRCHQWVKNILVILPIIFAHRFQDWQALYHSFLGFFAFCFAASSIYIINDLVDLFDDRQHPDKKFRPLAAGDVSLMTGLRLVPALLALAFVCASMLPLKFSIILVCYVAATAAYSFYLKQIAIADILVLAGLYCGRLFAGGAASNITLSPWLIAFTCFFFLSLALVKRCSELLMLQTMNQSQTRGRGYTVQDTRLLVSLGVASAYISILVLALYVSSENAKSLYANKDLLWSACPIALYWISRIWLITNRGEMHSDPIAFAARDRVSWALSLVVFCFWLAAHGFA